MCFKLSSSLLNILFISIFTACSSGHITHFVQRGEQLFEIQSRGSGSEVGDFFFLTSHKLCFEKFNKGFELQHWSVPKRDQVHGIVACKGKPDQFWINKLTPAFASVKELPSNIYLHGGRFNFTLEELENQGTRVR